MGAAAWNQPRLGRRGSSGAGRALSGLQCSLDGPHLPAVARARGDLLPRPPPPPHSCPRAWMIPPLCRPLLRGAQGISLLQQSLLPRCPPFTFLHLRWHRHQDVQMSGLLLGSPSLGPGNSLRAAGCSQVQSTERPVGAIVAPQAGHTHVGPVLLVLTNKRLHLLLKELSPLGLHFPMWIYAEHLCLTWR